MLDFYLIPDIQPTPASPESLEHAGALGSRSFRLLKEKQFIPPHYDYYTDFRWNSAVVQQLENTVLKTALQADTDVQQLLVLLRAARERQSGLVAYAD